MAAAYYDDGYGEPTWMRVLRALNASFRIGRFFGVEVRMYWLTFLIVPIFFGDVLRAASGAAEALVLILTGFVLLELVTYTHEMGHIAMGWRYGMPTRLITLSPIGGLAHIMARAPSPRAEIAVTAAGPVVHLPWLALSWLLLQGVGYETLKPEAWVYSPVRWGAFFLYEINKLMLLLNLLPFFPLDGGRILRALLSFRLNPNRASVIACYVGFAGAAGFVVLGFAWYGIYGTLLVVLGISNALACWQELRSARHLEAYAADDLLQPWQSDPEAWKDTSPGASGGAEPEPGPARGPGLAARLLGRLAGRKKGPAPAPASGPRDDDEAAPEPAATPDEVDRILARISEVGMAGLTERERQTLARASQALRARRSGR
jgi:Zn-dependent protease